MDSLEQLPDQWYAFAATCAEPAAAHAIRTCASELRLRLSLAPETSGADWQRAVRKALDYLEGGDASKVAAIATLRSLLANPAPPTSGEGWGPSYKQPWQEQADAQPTPADESGAEPTGHQPPPDDIGPYPMAAAQEDDAQATFTTWFCLNYPGPHTIISDPNWHAPRVFRQALWALRDRLQPSGAAPQDVTNPEIDRAMYAVGFTGKPGTGRFG